MTRPHRCTLAFAVLCLTSTVGCGGGGNQTKGGGAGAGGSMGADAGGKNDAAGGAGTSGGAAGKAGAAGGTAGTIGSAGATGTGGAASTGTGGAASTGTGGATSTGAGGATSTGTGGAATSACDDPALTWKTGAKTNFTSYPAPGSAECIQYSGCMYEGEFAGCDQTEPLAWVMSHNIVAAFPDFTALKLHDLCLKSSTGKTIVVTVLDTCGDSDCNGCCTQNKGTAAELIDVESFTDMRWGVPDGRIQWADLGPTKTSGCK